MQLPKATTESDKPKTLRETIYTSTPVVLTVLATILAGLSSGELTRSQYYRSMASQIQSKASDQWAYYQAKKSRAVDARNSLDLLVATAHPGRLDPARLAEASARLTREVQPATGGPATQAVGLDANFNSILAAAKSAMAFGSVDASLTDGNDKPVGDPDIEAALAAIDQDQTEAQMAPLLRHISDEQMTAALHAAYENLQAFDQSVEPAAVALDRLHAALSARAQAASDVAREQPGQGAVAAEADIAAAGADISAAQFRFSSLRYDREAKYNGVSAQLYEIQVRQSGVYADRHRVRSNNFFYGMLVAQAGVTISTLSLAVRRRSIFWSLAAVTGAAAVGFSGYIYLYT